MQEHRYNGHDVLTPNVDVRQFESALKDPRNKAVTLHKTGSIITLPDGSRYEVRKGGMLRKLKHGKAVR